MKEYKTLSLEYIKQLSDQQLIDHMHELNKTVDQQYFALEAEFDWREVDQWSGKGGTLKVLYHEDEV